MMNLTKTYKYRIYPTVKQCEEFERIFGCCRFVWNHFLDIQNTLYHDSGEIYTYPELCKSLTKLKSNAGYMFLKDVSNQTLQSSLRHLDSAFSRFFREISYFPRRKLKDAKQSFELCSQFIVSGNHFKVPKIKTPIRIKLHRPLEGKIHRLTVVKYPSGKYYVCIVTKQLIKRPKKQNKHIDVGIDLGIKSFAVTSDGIKFPNPKFCEQYLKELSTAKRHLSRKKKGSRQYENQRLKVARIYEKITNCRRDMHYKLTHYLLTHYGEIYLETLSIKDMIKNSDVACKIYDCGWRSFIDFLTYRSAYYYVKVRHINRWYPSSQICHTCGWINHKVKDLDIRIWSCPSCGTTHDRDINAAINILNEGRLEYHKSRKHHKNKSSGTGDNTDGETVRLRNRKKSKQVSMKSEVCL